MLVLDGSTPESTRLDIVGYLSELVARYERQQASARTKREAGENRARVNALRSAVLELTSAHLEPDAASLPATEHSAEDIAKLRAALVTGLALIDAIQQEGNT